MKELCTQLKCIILFLGYPLFIGCCNILIFLLFINNLSLMSKVIIIIIKDLLLNENALLVSLKPIEPFQIFNNAINWLFNIIHNNLDITEFF